MHFTSHPSLGDQAHLRCRRFPVSEVIDSSCARSSSRVSSRRIDEFLLRGRLQGQDAHLTTFSQEIKSPLQQHEEAIGKSNEKVNMHDSPNDPCREACELYEPQVGYCVCPAYDCEIALVPIPEWFRVSVTCHSLPNDISHVFTLLDRRLGYSWHRHRGFRFDAQQISHRSNDMCGVANSKDFPMSRDRQVWSYNDLSRSVSFCSEPAPGRRRNNSRSPQYSGRLNSLSANDNPFRIYAGHTSIGVNRNAQTLQVLLRFD